jgi:hypothetical protein
MRELKEMTKHVYVRTASALCAGFGLIMMAIITNTPSEIRGPKPYPEEWQWPLRETAINTDFLPIILSVVLLLVGLYLTHKTKILDTTERGFALILIIAILAGWSLQLALINLEPGGATAYMSYKTMGRTATSYHWVSRSPEARDPIQFLKIHHRILEPAKKMDIHVSTHPPGAVLAFRGLTSITEQWSGLRVLLLNKLRSIGIVESVTQPKQTPATLAAALLGALILSFCGALCALPIGLMVTKLSGSMQMGSSIALLWPFIPAPALICAQFDQLLALLVASTNLALLHTLDPKSSARSIWLWILFASCCASLGCFISYGTPVFLVFTTIPLLGYQNLHRTHVMRYIQQSSIVTIFTISLAFGLPALLGHSPILAFQKAMQIHFETFHLPRSYWSWLLFNPWDFMLWSGLVTLPLLCINKPTFIFSRKTWLHCDSANIPRMRFLYLLCICLLVLSGSTRGEVGRIWLPLMPMLMTLSFSQVPEWFRLNDSKSKKLMFLLAGLLLCLSLCIRIMWQTH